MGTGCGWHSSTVRGGLVFPYMLQSTWVVMEDREEPTVVPTLHSNEKLRNVNVKNTFYMNEM